MNFYTSQYSHYDSRILIYKIQRPEQYFIWKKASFIYKKWNSKIFICWRGCFRIRFDLLPYSLLQPPAPPPPPRRPSRTTTKPSAGASSIGGRKPKYAAHHEHQKSHPTRPHCDLLKYALSTSVHSYRGRLFSSIQCRASAPQWHWCSGGERKALQYSGPQSMVDLRDVSTGLPLYGVYSRWPVQSSSQV